jgi:DUF1680 family protein
MKRPTFLLLVWAAILVSATVKAQTTLHPLEPVPLEAVQIEDPFWSPKLSVWRRATINDAFDKFEKAGAFRNFDRVAQGIQEEHEGPPWFDGLIYETMRAASDFIASQPDPALEKRLDGYIARIGAAAAKDPNGYVMTFTQLDRPDQRWGLNGGSIVWQHEIYDAGAMTEAATHHARATGKTRLLEIAVKLANYMCDTLGPAPKKRVIPGHALPEEAFVGLYELFHENPALRSRLSVSVDEDRYLALAKYWIEDRGHDRPGGTEDIKAYSQDHLPMLEQTTIEGHAVRATLCWAGVSAAARYCHQQTYTDAAARVWDNMTGKCMYITGGVGAHQEEERFGSDYDLPNHGYLETCAAVGAGFFHRNMNLLLGQARYADELERVLYNNILNGVSLEGTHYYYQNPLAHSGRARWAWHSCPCCPPMFLKIVSALPGYIYATDGEGLYVNLFIGSHAKLNVGTTAITVSQKTEYPWDGAISVDVNPEEPATFTVFVRVPGWARGEENPFGLYESDLTAPKVTLKVNGETRSDLDLVRGYAAIERTWTTGDTITMELPMTVRRIHAHPAVEADRGRVALASGPLIYCLEETDNPQQLTYYLQEDSTLSLVRKPDLFDGVNIIRGQARERGAEGTSKQTPFTAIPYYCQDNRGEAARVDVWIPEQEELAAVAGLASKFTASASHCYSQDTVKALNDGVLPDDSNDHSIPRHTWWEHKGGTEWVQYDFDEPRSVSSVAVYWWDDRPAGGGCAVPRSWRLLYRDSGQWKPVEPDRDHDVTKDRFNEVRFSPVETTSLRLEVKLRRRYSAGILEWQVR